MAIIWKKVENDTPIRYNPEYGGEVSVEGGGYTSLVAYNTDPSSDSRVFNYIEKRIDYYHAKDDDKLTGKVYKVEIEPTNEYIEGKKLEYTRIHCGRNNTGYCTVWDYPVIWESDASAKIRWWWYNEDTHEKEEEIDVYVTLYEDVLDACVDYFEIPSGDAIEETEDHKFATEWSTAVVGGKVTKYSSTYAEDKKMTVTAKGTLEEDEDILYITYECEASEPTAGRTAFNNFCNKEVGTLITSIFGVNGNKYNPYLQTKFEKFSDNVYTAKANPLPSLASATVYNVVAVYNPNYDMFSYYLGKASDSAIAASDLESNWINTFASYSVYPEDGDTTESMLYNFTDVGIDKCIVLPSVATMTALAAEGKGVKLGALDIEKASNCQPGANKTGNPVKVDAPATAGGDAVDPETYTFSIIDDYYAYLSDAEISEDDAPSMEETINHKYAVEWDSVAVGGKATPYDPTGYTENKTGTIAAKGTLKEDDDLKYISFAGDGGPGKEVFDAIVNSPVGTRFTGIYNNNSTSSDLDGALTSTFDEKVPGELYYAKLHTDGDMDTWIMAIYNPDYDVYGLFQAKQSYASDASSDYPSWKARVTSNTGKFNQQLDSDSTTSEVWYSPVRQALIVIPTQSTQDTYCNADTGGVDLFGSMVDYVVDHAILSSNKNIDSAPSKFVPEPGATYAYNIIDDYYAYLSDAELLGEPDGPDWSSVTATADDVLPGKKFFDNTGTLVEGDMPLTITTAVDKNVKRGITYYTWDGTNLVMHTGIADFSLPSNLDGRPFEPDNITFYTGTDVVNRTPVPYSIDDMLDGGWLFTMQVTLDNKNSSIWGSEYIPPGETALLDNDECVSSSVGTAHGEGRIEIGVLKIAPNDGHRPLQMIPSAPSSPSDRGMCLIDISYNLENMFPEIEPTDVRDAFHDSSSDGSVVHMTSSAAPAVNRRGSISLRESNMNYMAFYMMASNTTALDETNFGITAYSGKTNIWSITDSDKENGTLQAAIDSRTYYTIKSMPGGGSFIIACCYLEAGSFEPADDIMFMADFNLPSDCTDWWFIGLPVKMSNS